MIRKLLIANRGEIACRIIRTCHEMGIGTVAIYSDADTNALHVEMADEAVHIGPSAATESYLNIEKIITAAHRTGAAAVHPGYGFLAENAQFAYAVKNAGLVFIGPSPESIEAMGDKRTAKLLLKNIPFVPGYVGEDQSNQAMVEAAQEIGFPIMVKATAGGGGKGMRQVLRAEDLPDALEAARREAKQAFGDDTLMLEHFVSEPRHIEIQIFGDQYGNIIALGERECTIQRRHQKIIEETPSTALTPELRQAICDAAVNAGKQLGYYNAGTVEFLLDEAGNFYFMEMNTRLQVEHPVTEMVYGIDLVRWQIQAARGLPLEQIVPPGSTPEAFSQHSRGHAVEVRIYAEDPANKFLPVTGKIQRWRSPTSARVDTGIRSGDVISPHYDPMIAKMITHGETRVDALRKMDYALSRLQLMGMRSNIAFLRRVITHPDHLAGLISTHFIDEHANLLHQEAPISHAALIAAALSRSSTTHWRNNPNRPIRHRFQSANTDYEILLTLQDTRRAIAQIGAEQFQVEWAQMDENTLSVTVNGHRQMIAMVNAGDHCWIHTLDGTNELLWQSPLPAPNNRASTQGSLRSPMPGQIIKVFVEIGQEVKAGAVLLIIEAMKMEHRIEAPYAGIVRAIHYGLNHTVQSDEILLEIEPLVSES